MKKMSKVLLGSLVFLSIYTSDNVSAQETIYEAIPSENSGLLQDGRPISPQSNQQRSLSRSSILPSKFDYTSGNIQTTMRNQ